MKRYSIIFMSFLAALMVSCKDEDANAPLKADFEESAAEVLVGDEVTFTDISTGSPTKWNWIFEGAETETSILSQPVVRWLKTGTFTVRLSVSRKDESSELVKEKLVHVGYHTSVKADFTMDKKMAFDNQEVTFTNKSTGFPENIKWTFTPKEGEPVVSTEENPKLIFLPGIYSIRLEVSNAIASDAMEVENAFTILDRFAVMSEFSARNTTTYAGGNVTFVDESTGNVQNREWTFEGGEPATSTEASPVVRYSSVGTYKVRLRTYNEKYSDVAEKEGYIHVVPSNGLVFLLPFDGDILDYGPYSFKAVNFSMSKNDKTLTLSYEDAVTEGRGKSVKFPGGSAKGGPYSVIQMPDELATQYPDGSEMTVSFWAKLPETSVSQAVFAQGDCPGAADINNQIWARFQSKHQFRCTAEKGKLKANTVTSTDTKFDDGTWHNIAIVYSRTSKPERKLEIFLDGVSKGTQVAADKDTRSLPYFIGCNLRRTNGAWAPENIFTGNLDDYVLYRRALSVDEIKVIASMR